MTEKAGRFQKLWKRLKEPSFYLQKSYIMVHNRFWNYNPQLFTGKREIGIFILLT